MPYTCTCGEVISLSSVPNPNQFPVFSDGQLEAVQDAIVSGLDPAAGTSLAQRQKVVSVAVMGRHPDPEIIECPACGRLALFRSAGDTTPAMDYLPERTGDDPPFRLRNLFS